MPGKASRADWAATVPWDGVLNKPAILTPADVAAQIAAAKGGTTTIIKQVSAPAVPAVSNPLQVAFPTTWFDITKYGAVPDGTTDNLFALNAALAAAVAAGGGAILVPGGGVFLTSTFTIASSLGITLFSFDRTSTTLRAKDSTTPILAITGDSVTVKDLALDGGYLGGATSGDFGIIDLVACNYVSILGCTIANALDRAIRIYDACSHIAVRGCLIQNYYRGIQSYPNPTTHAVAQSLDIQDNTIQNCWAGAADGAGIKITSNDGDLTTTTRSLGHRITNNQLYNPGTLAIELWGGCGDSLVNDNIIDTCQFGISINGTDRTVVAGNTIRRCTFVSLEAAESCYDLIFLGNIISCYNTDGTRGGGGAISITGHTPFAGLSPTRVKVVGGSIGGSGGSAIGVQLVSGGVDIGSGLQIYDCDTMVTIKDCSDVSLDGIRMTVGSHPTYNMVFVDSTDFAVANLSFQNCYFTGDCANGAAFIFYDGSSGHHIDNVAILQNNLSQCLTTNSVAYWMPQANVTNITVRNNVNLTDYFTGAPPPFDPSIQFGSIPIATKFSFTVPVETGDTWWKIYSLNQGTPYILGFHLDGDFLAADNKADSITASISVGLYGGPAGIITLPHSGPDVIKGIICNNPGTGPIIEIWLRLSSTGGGTITVGGSDKAGSWITDFVANPPVLIEPSWSANKVELDTYNQHETLKMTCGLTLGNTLQLDNAYVGTPTIPTGYLLLTDSNGAVYEIPAKAH